MSWVVDSSIAIAWCFEDETTERTERLLDRLNTEPAIVPSHWSLEVTNVLRSAIRRRRIDEDVAARRVVTLMSLPLQFDLPSHHLAFTDTYRIAREHGLTTYDAAYLELAIRLGADLATDDAELASAAAKAGIRVI